MNTQHKTATWKDNQEVKILEKFKNKNSRNRYRIENIHGDKLIAGEDELEVNN